MRRRRALGLVRQKACRRRIRALYAYRSAFAIGGSVLTPSTGLTSGLLSAAAIVVHSRGLFAAKSFILMPSTAINASAMPVQFLSSHRCFESFEAARIVWAILLSSDDGISELSIASAIAAKLRTFTLKNLCTAH